LQVCATLLKLAKTQPETGLINFDQLELGLHGSKISANREAENLQRGRRSTIVRDPSKQWEGTTSAQLLRRLERGGVADGARPAHRILLCNLRKRAVSVTFDAIRQSACWGSTRSLASLPDPQGPYPLRRNSPR
jgi:hypothetical protein